MYFHDIIKYYMSYKYKKKQLKIIKLYPYASETQQHETVTSLSLIVRLRRLKDRNIVSRRESRELEKVWIPFAKKTVKE